MKNSTKSFLALSLLAALTACGDDDSEKTDSGNIPIIPILDAGKPDTGAPVTPPAPDSGTTTPITDLDSGVPSGDCFSGTPTKMVDFLNRCTTVQTATKTLAVPANLLNADGSPTAL